MTSPSVRSAYVSTQELAHELKAPVEAILNLVRSGDVLRPRRSAGGYQWTVWEALDVERTLLARANCHRDN